LLAALAEVEIGLGEILAAVDPNELHPADAAALLNAFVSIERLAGGGRVLVADRASMSQDWTRSGCRSPEEWLADKAKTSYGEAKNTLDTSRKLKDLPRTRDAIGKGRLSGAQLNEIGPAATPENEGRLLDAARNEDQRGLKKTCAREKDSVRSEDDERARHARIHRERHFKSWTDRDGAYCYAGRTTADEGARIDAAIAAMADRVFKAAHAEGRRETAAAYRSDALLALLTEGGVNVSTEVVIRVDSRRLEGGEGMCETDQGPVPVDTAIGAILAGAFVKVVQTDGIDVFKVCHPGRYRPVELDTAIRERDGGCCVRPGCSSTHRLEVHHYVTGKNGPTEHDNLATLCAKDHRLVTNKGHVLTGKPGAWRWIEPPRRC
jgi:hypothetical protein